MHPQVWKCSGHYDLFHDYMVDCRESKRRYRHDQVQGRWVSKDEQRIFVATELVGAEAEEDVLHKDDVAALDGDVRPAPDGDPDVGLGKGRGVVYAVADEPHDLTVFLKPLHLPCLVLGEHLREDPGRCRHCGRLPLPSWRCPR